MTKYFTLFVYETDHQRWYNYFGDYDKQTVIDERDDLNQGYDGILKQHMTIVQTRDDQSSINWALDKLNGKI